MFKLFRLVRFKSLAKSSGVIETWWERQGVAKIMLIKFIFGMVLISVSLFIIVLSSVKEFRHKQNLPV